MTENRRLRKELAENLRRIHINQFSDLELVSQSQENPYYQYFIGLPGYQEEEPCEATILVSFRKRLSAEIIAEANECIINPKKAAALRRSVPIRKQLGYVMRNLRYLEGFTKYGYTPSSKEAKLISTIYKVYQQQGHMYKNKTYSVPDRIVSISQPYIRPIVRGKVKSSVAIKQQTLIKKLLYNRKNE
jgi:hypothetical protein